MEERLKARITAFCKWADARDFALLNLRGEPNPYIGDPQLRNHKITNWAPPAYMSLVEQLVDLKIYVERDDFESALPLWKFLKRLIGEPPQSEERMEHGKPSRMATENHAEESIVGEASYGGTQC